MEIIKVNVKHHKPIKGLTPYENELITKLIYFKDDINVKIRHTIKGESKILAIAIYDICNGCILKNDYVGVLIYKALYKKLFNKDIETLF